MRIGIVLDNDLDSDHRVLKQIRQLVKNDHQVFVICFDFGNTSQTYSNFTVSRIKIPRSLKNLLVLLNNRTFFYEYLWIQNISRFLLKYKIEALHCHDLYLSKPSKKGIEKSKKTIPLTLDLHENYPYAINTYQWAIRGWRKYVVQPKKWFEKELEYLEYADNIITLSGWFANYLQKKYPSLKSKKFVVHPNLLEYDSFQKNQNNTPETEFQSPLSTLFYFGVIAKRRGIMEVIPWLEEALGRGLKFHLLLAGPTDNADQKELEELLKLPNLKNNFTYIPWIDITNLPYYLNKCDIGLAPFEVNPQHNSGVANKIYQYMYGKLAILATACKAQKELITDTECGYIYEDKESFLDYLRILLTNHESRKHAGANGHKKIIQLSEEKVDEAFLELYK